MSSLTAKVAALCVVGLASMPVVACDDYNGSSVMMKSDKNLAVCEETAGIFESISERFLSLFQQGESAEQDNGDYWGEWAFNTENNPIISGRVEKNVVGVGFWLPDELEEAEHDMSYDEWLKSHGLQLSFAVGDKGKDTRVRFDYRWHEVHAGDLMLQLEVPF